MSDTHQDPYDAILLVSFGGPERKEDVIPFLENVLRGKPVPRERMLEVAEHYYQFGGVSPINAQNRTLLAALRAELDRHEIGLPIYWGNRNWHPLLADTLRQMSADGIARALAFVTSAFSSYSGCRQYRENIHEACQGIRAEMPPIDESQPTAGPIVPQVDKIRVFFNHPGYIEPMVQRTQEALRQLREQLPLAVPREPRVLFTAHSIPLSMAQNCAYEQQLQEACRLVMERIEPAAPWSIVYQSRSGSPQVPWLSPDICDYLKENAGRDPGVVIVPIGFVSDHLEVLYDLDTAARQVCHDLNLPMIRVGTVGTDPRFVSMVRELIQERLDPRIERRALGSMGPSHDLCPVDCCRAAGPPLSPRPPDSFEPPSRR